MIAAMRHCAGAALLLAATLPVTVAMAAADERLPDGEVTLEIEGFTLYVTGTDGRPTHRLEGSRLREFGHDGPQLVDDPDLHMFDPDGIQWHWTAPMALHRPADEHLELLGDTRGVQPARADRVETIIETRDVKVATDTRVATSDALSTLTQPGFFQSGIGLRVDAQADTMELFHDVYSLYSEPAEEGSNR